MLAAVQVKRSRRDSSGAAPATAAIAASAAAAAVVAPSPLRPFASSVSLTFPSSSLDSLQDDKQEDSDAT